MKINKNDFKNVIKKNFNATIISNIIMIFLGFLLFFQAENTLKTISYIVGIFLLVIEIVQIVKMFVNHDNKIYFETNFIIGVFCSIMGFILLINETLLTSILPFCIGTFIIINSVIKMQVSFTLKEKSDNTWSKVFIYSIIVMILGLLLIINPFKGAVIATRIIGIFLIIYSISDIFGTSILKKQVKNNIKIIDAEE